MSNQIEPHQTSSNNLKHLSNYFELFKPNRTFSNNFKQHQTTSNCFHTTVELFNPNRTLFEHFQTISNNFKLLHQTLKN
jgi:hypothetical protein